MSSLRRSFFAPLAAGLFAAMIPTATPASAAACSLPITFVPSSQTPNLQKADCTLDSNVTAIKVEVHSSAGEATPSGALGGRGVSIEAWAEITTERSLYYALQQTQEFTCTDGNSYFGGTGAVVNIGNPLAPNGVAAGGGGGAGCPAISSGVIFPGGHGGDAGTPTVSLGIAAGSAGQNSPAGPPPNGGAGGGAGGGSNGAGGPSADGNCNGASAVAADAPFDNIFSRGGLAGGCGFKGGNGGSGYRGGGAGGGGKGFPGTTGAGGGGGGSSWIDSGGSWTLLSATPRSTSGWNEASITISDYTSTVEDANLSSLSTDAGALSPSFASGTTLYTTSVDYDVATTTITPTVSQSGATVTVNGSTVTSGSASSSINLDVGITSVDVVVTAIDGTTTKTYTIQFNRAPAPLPGGPPGPTPEGNRQLTVANPISLPEDVSSGSVIVEASVDGSATGLISLRNPTNTGWSLSSGSGETTIDVAGQSGGATSLAANGALQVTPGGSINVSSSGYKPGSIVYVFAIPRNQVTNGSGTVGSIYLAAFTVNSDGTISGTVSIPGGMSVGDYVLQMNGISATDQIRSLNLGMNVVGQVTGSNVTQVVNAAFFQPKSSDLSVNGRRKLEAMVGELPLGASVTQMVVVGVAEFDRPLGKNIDLATRRADEIARFLNDRQVGNSQTTVRFIQASDDGANRRFAFDSQGEPIAVESLDALELSEPAQSSTGKSLSSVRITYQVAW